MFLIWLRKWWIACEVYDVLLFGGVRKTWCFFLIRTFCVSFQISLVCLLYPVSLKACQNWSTKYVQMTPPVSWKPQSSSGNFFQMVLDMFNARCNSFLFCYIYLILAMSVEKNSTVIRIIRADVLPRLAEFLSRHGLPQLQVCSLVFVSSFFSLLCFLLWFTSCTFCRWRRHGCLPT